MDVFLLYVGAAILLASLVGIALNLRDIAAEMRRKNDREEKKK